MKSEIRVLEHTSKVLKNNPLGDPFRRSVLVYLPESYKKNNGKRFPVVYLISGFTGYGALNMNLSPFSENIQQRIDRLIASGKINEMIVVMPDCFTKYGGSQYVNSTATGKYEDYIVKEIVPFIDNNFRTLPQSASRCIAGKSSGGYGAMWLAMRNPGVFGLMATHSGDSAFEYCYMPDFANFIIDIQKYGSGHKAVQNFIKSELNIKQPKGNEFHNILNIIGMSSCYSPNPKRREYNFDLPFDIYTAEIIPEIWNKWLKHDPVRMVTKYKVNLKKLKLIYIDCGIKDEFRLYSGARIFAGKLNKIGIKSIHKEFNAGHFNIQYRYDESFPVISKYFAYK
ncbi:MAG: esterase [Ignavibacteria bacterium]|nr:esterase [Ignavibacteria bacterium]